MACDVSPVAMFLKKHPNLGLRSPLRPPQFGATKYANFRDKLATKQCKFKFCVVGIGDLEFEMVYLMVERTRGLTSSQDPLGIIDKAS